MSIRKTSRPHEAYHGRLAALRFADEEKLTWDGRSLAKFKQFPLVGECASELAEDHRQPSVADGEAESSCRHVQSQMPAES